MATSRYIRFPSSFPPQERHFFWLRWMFAGRISRVFSAFKEGSRFLSFPGFLVLPSILAQKKGNVDRPANPHDPPLSALFRSPRQKR
jgi:hypothetical protein